MSWTDDLCEYYGVSESEAIELGTRSPGRRPNFPGSATCRPVCGKTFEELWEENPRNTVQQKMDFYKDIGSWQVFRQCHSRQNFNYNKYFGKFLQNRKNILEYGCGVAPFINYIIENMDLLRLPDDMKFCLVDVAGEHLEFAKWRLHKKSPSTNFVFHEISEQYSVPDFEMSFDICCIMDVLEHLPNPYDVIRNIHNHSNQDSVMVMTWIDKSDGGTSGPDLEESELQRVETMNFINSCYKCIKGGSIKAYVKRQ